MSTTKLELTWIGKNQRHRLEPRILVEDPKWSYHADRRYGEHDHFDNRLVFGDNLLALKALEQEFAGKIKCVFIDPPYNTGSAFAHYDDGVEHSQWLLLMRDRLELLRSLLAFDGSIWISIDDNEGHYLKVLCDEIFGRSNFIATVVWQKKYTQANDAEFFSDNHDFILVFAKDRSRFTLQGLPRSDQQNKAYRNPDNDPRGPWKATPLHAKSGNASGFSFKFLNGVIWRPPAGTFPRFSVETFKRMDLNKEIWFGQDGTAIPSRKTYLSEVQQSVVPKSVWLYDEVGHNHEARNEAKGVVPDDPFGTPKPERLLERIITLATRPGDWVLDSFAGSGTTGAVAHKMNRRWIMVELGEHCHTHIIPRLTKVIDGADPGGVTEATDWKRGGGFRYYKLAPSLLEKDQFGNWIISKKHNPAMLAEAMCKLEGFSFAPSETDYWQHGRSSEQDFIYVTTQTLTRAQIETLSEEVGEHRTLLICCGAYRTKPDAFPNLTIKKIPKAVMQRCEWGRDDYSLQIASLLAAPEPEPEDKSASFPTGESRKKRKQRVTTPSLFGQETE